MKRLPLIILVLALTQTSCLAIGLWIQNRLIVALAEWSNEKAATATESGIEPPDGLPETTPDPEEAEAPSPVTPQTQPAEFGQTDLADADGQDGVTAASLRSAMHVTMPFSLLWIGGLQAIVAYLVLIRLHTEHAEKESRSQEASVARAKELVRTRDAVVFGLAKLAESRDPDTGHHLERIALYSTRLASALRRDRRFRDMVTPAFARSIGISSALHDIGKVGVRDSILLKPGKLTADERAEMQTHTTVGGECIRRIEQRLGTSNFLGMAREIAYSHHERWDGAGYPAGLKGEQIPLAARIVAIADVYDALASQRAYKTSFPHEKCVEMIRKEAGRQFDPHLVGVFLSIEDQFRAISARFREDLALDTDISRGEVFGEVAAAPPALARPLARVRSVAAIMAGLGPPADDTPWPTQVDSEEAATASTTF